jgi:transcriptional regulator with XRE-family HTH domain
MALGQRVKERRTALGFSQEHVAHQAGLSWAAVQRLEAGKIADPHYSTLSAIAHALGTTVAELVGEAAAVVPLAEASETGQTEVEERDTPGVALAELSRRTEFTAQLADVLEAEIEGVERDRTFPHFAWDYRIESTISHLVRQLDKDEILDYVAEVREGRRLAQNEERRLAVALASNLSRLRHLVERAHVIAEILHVDSHVEGVKDTARPVADILEEWERASVPSEARHD